MSRFHMKQRLGPSRLALVLAGGLAVAAGCSPAMRNARHMARGDNYFQAGKYQEATIEYLHVVTAEPANPVANRQLGLALYESGKGRAAVPYLLCAETAEPTNHAVTLKLGTIYLTAGDRPQAHQRAQSVLERSSDNLDALILWANSVTTSNELNEALQRLHPLLPRFPNEPAFHIALATLYGLQGDAAAAETIYRQALTTHPSSWELHLALGDAYLGRRATSQAEQEYQSAAALAPIASLAHIRLARFRHATGKTAAAKTILTNMLHQVPLHGPALFCLAEITFSENQYAETAALLNKLMQAEPSNLAAFLLLQRVHLAQGQTDEAIAGYERLITLLPKSAPGHYYLGLAHLQQGAVPQAVRALETAVALRPDYAEPLRTLAELQLRTGQPEAALELLKAFTKRFPDDLPANLLLAAAYAARKDDTKASEIYRAMLKVAPENPQIPFRLGLLLLRQKKATEAEAQFEAALQLDPAFMEPLLQLATLDAARTKRWDTAIQRIRDQIEKTPIKGGLYALLGEIHARARDWPAAERSFQQAITNQPEAIAAYLGLSRVYEATGQRAQALTNVDKALALKPKDLTARMLKANLLQLGSDFAGAATLYQQIIALTPSLAAAWNNLACLYHAPLNRGNEAFDLAKQARLLAPRDPAIADTLGWIAYTRGETKWALTLLQESAEKLPGEPQVQYHLGICQSALGDEEAARTSLNRALELSTEFPGASETRSMLTVLATSTDLHELATTAALAAFVDQHPSNSIALVRAGTRYEALGETLRAQQAYERALQCRASLVAAQVRLAKLYAGPLQQPEKALTLAKQARAAAPTDPQAADLLGWLAFQQGDYQRARSLLADSAAQGTMDPEQLYHWGMLQYVTGKTTLATNLIAQSLATSVPFSAAPDARRFLEQCRNPADALRLIKSTGVTPSLRPELLPGLMALADAYTRDDETEKALALCEKLTQQFPDFTPAYRALALGCLGQTNAADSRYPLLTKARELLPEDPYVGFALGAAAARQGQHAYAARILQASANQLPDRADLHYLLGQTYYQLSKPAAARQALQQALRLDPNPQSPAAVGARALLIQTM